MKAVVKTSPGPGSLALVEMPEPEPRDGHLLVRIKAAGICGSDLHVYHWTDRAARSYSPPAVMGHELCGEILWAPPGESRLRVGDLVCVETHDVCGHCYLCERGEGHVCLNMRRFSRSGYSAMAEFTLVPVGCARRIPAGVSVEVGSAMEPLGVAVHALQMAPPAAAFVGVMGCGPVGLFAIAVARALGARKIFAVEPAPFRRQLAREMGADSVIDPGETSASEVMREGTDGRGVDVLVEASGQPEALVDGLRGLRRAGVAALVGVPSKPVTLDMEQLVIHRAATLHGIFARRINTTWHIMEALLTSGVLDVSKVITHRLPLADYQQAFDLASSGAAGKVLLIP